MIQQLIQKIREKGYVELEMLEAEFLRTANLLGTIKPSRRNGPLIDVLKPKEMAEAHPNSLSALHGLGSFPFHTDGAYFLTPPKYVGLRCGEPQASETPTQLLPTFDSLSENQREDLSREVWQVRGRIQNFYSPILVKKSGQIFIRYDQACMKPIKSDSISALISRLDHSRLAKSIFWHPNKVLIFDNWRCLHARPPINTIEKAARSLQRLMIYG